MPHPQNVYYDTTKPIKELMNFPLNVATALTERIGKLDPHFFENALQFNCAAEIPALQAINLSNVERSGQIFAMAKLPLELAITSVGRCPQRSG